MIIKTSVTRIYNCNLERAFKCPMLCDLRKIHIGSKVVPKVTHTSDDESWGKVGGYRKVFMAKAFGFKGGYAALDTVLERDENKHWKIEITDIKSQSLGLYKFQGEWCGVRDG